MRNAFSSIYLIFSLFYAQPITGFVQCASKGELRDLGAWEIILQPKKPPPALTK
jgi:hypothetical protein